jgi:hypothetical protein
MHTGTKWIGVTILNMSSRGLMLRIEGEVSRGTYVEVRRGRLTIVARVVWVKDGQLGMRTQDHIDIAAVVNEPRLSARPGPLTDSGLQAERRSDARRDAALSIASQAERSRTFASAFQFVAIAIAGSLASITLFGAVSQILTNVSDTIQKALSGG